VHENAINILKSGGLIFDNLISSLLLRVPFCGVDDGDGGVS